MKLAGLLSSKQDKNHRSLKKNLMADLMRPYETFGQILCPILMTFKVYLKDEIMSHICWHIWGHLTTFKETLKVITRWTLRKPKVTYMWHIWRHTCDIYMTFKVTLKVTLECSRFWTFHLFFTYSSLEDKINYVKAQFKWRGFTYFAKISEAS